MSLYTRSDDTSGDLSALVEILTSREEHVVRAWSVRFGGNHLATTARELVHAVIRGLRVGQRMTEVIAGPAQAIGLVRAQQNHTATTLVEDVAELRALLTTEVEASIPELDPVVKLGFYHRLSNALDLILSLAMAIYVDESTRVGSRNSTRDSVTGISNRVALDSALVEVCSSSAGSGRVSFVIFDLDNFRDINHYFGHLAGDEVLMRVAEASKLCIGSFDTVARLGGDEFAIVMPGADGEAAARLVRNVVRAMERDRFVSGMGVSMSVSVGIAEVDTPTSPSTLFGAAERALARAKRDSGDGVEFAKERDFGPDRVVGPSVGVR